MSIKVIIHCAFVALYSQQFWVRMTSPPVAGKHRSLVTSFTLCCQYMVYSVLQVHLSCRTVGSFAWEWRHRQRLVNVEVLSTYPTLRTNSSTLLHKRWACQHSQYFHFIYLYIRLRQAGSVSVLLSLVWDKQVYLNCFTVGFFVCVVFCAFVTMTLWICMYVA